MLWEGIYGGKNKMINDYLSKPEGTVVELLFGRRENANTLMIFGQEGYITVISKHPPTYAFVTKKELLRLNPFSKYITGVKVYENLWKYLEEKQNESQVCSN